MTEPQIARPDTAQELNRLKDFQRLSVETVFRRMYLDQTPTRRFLLADEVGLGKTLVARGVIARTIDQLWEKVPRIDIIYLCSNSDIARQNVNRLTPFGISGVSVATRITLLPIEATNFKSRKVNVVALTPGTSLNVKGNLGLKLERALLLHLLETHWGLPKTGARRMFTRPAALQGFKSLVHHFAKYYKVDEDLKAGFLTALDRQCSSEAAQGRPTIRKRVHALVQYFESDVRVSGDTLKDAAEAIGELRHILAKSCIQALQPDLIVLDEFQRFKEILDGKGPAGEMARELFEYEDSSTEARVLLLSATPYKMYTVQDDAGGEDHYADFLRTAQFLFAENRSKADALGSLLKRYRHELFRLGQGSSNELTRIRSDIEQLLREVMLRTERLAVTPDRNGMLAEKPVASLHITADDAENYRRLQALARLIEHSDTMEYWKAAPWLLNFMDTYKFRTEIDSLIEEPKQPSSFVKAMRNVAPALVDFDAVNAFRKLDPGHGRVRWLTEQMLDNGLWKLLWLPPTHPYYRLASPFDEAALHSPTKALLFSAWRVVPRVAAAALSFEAERRMYVSLDGSSRDLTDAPERLGDMLQVKRKGEKAAGLTTLALLYPSPWLARTCDPLILATELASALGETPTLEQLVTAAEGHIAPALDKVVGRTPERTTPDESWYWAAPVLLDQLAAGKRDAWLDRDLATLWGRDSKRRKQESDEDDESTSGDQDDVDSSEEDRSALDDLVTTLRRTSLTNAPSGVPPRDLLRVLAVTAIASPATAALRAFSRVAGPSVFDSMAARDAAARVGAAFRTLFNQPDATAVVRATARERGDSNDYWKECLLYCAGGCVQATLDEYAHLLVGEAGVFGKPPDQIAIAVGQHMASAIALKRASVGAHNIKVKDQKVRSSSESVRSRFAMRFGEETASERGEKVRADEVRNAFNSPFWPFLLATTSVGQEGLDFHQYCHRVIHWNLPPNPVDLEQREGRVHRFKGHAVRKNVAKRHADVWSAETNDPWEAAFEAAKLTRKPDDNDLVPFWVYPLEGGATIERYVPAYPLSRDIERFKALRESLALYRMVFGQPRQEELLAYLVNTVPPEDISDVAKQLMISLAPRTTTSTSTFSSEGAGVV